MTKPPCRVVIADDHPIVREWRARRATFPATSA
jgi:hypothetical protein